MTPRQEFITSTETAWSMMLSEYTVPNVAILLSWFRFYTIENVLEAIEETAKIANRKGDLTSDAVGRICSSTARKMQAAKLAANPAYEQPFPERA